MSKEKMHDCNCEENVENMEDCGCDCGCDCGDEHDHDDCGCGCGDHESLVVELEDENGNIVPCEVVDQFDYKDNDYVLVQNPEDGSVYLFKVVGEGEEGELIIPEDDEFEEVSKYYEQSLEEEE